MQNKILKSEFEQLLDQPDDQISLAAGALMVARLEYSDLKIETELDRISRLADEIRDRLPENASVAEILTSLNKVLFVEKGFEGNSEHFYDPRNSFLNDVLNRKLGIPISLSILYIELGQRLGLPLKGISFPGHFLVKLDMQEGAIILDPYFGGISLSEEDIEERLQEFYGNKLKRRHFSGLLATTPNREIIIRVLRNLRNIYMQNHDWNKALTIADFMVYQDSDKLDSIKARAYIYDALECSRPAMEDYQEYLQISPEAEDIQIIRNRIIELAESCRHIC
ncbi:MAG: transglutaminase-like domain-containing protein [Gammaproteobacteria bacterium]|nr:transglutaminase-like domain-containing protein [Gammaproteobacteria bacterium]